jgi:hypothetical protein
VQLDLTEDTLLFHALEFSLEVPCFMADSHGSHEVHTGPSEAKFYVRFECSNCDTGGHVVAACQAWTDFLRVLIREDFHGWRHDPGCNGFNEFSKTTTIEPIG